MQQHRSGAQLANLPSLLLSAPRGGEGEGRCLECTDVQTLYNLQSWPQGDLTKGLLITNCVTACCIAAVQTFEINCLYNCHSYTHL